jgi:hypothetical protein
MDEGEGFRAYAHLETRWKEELSAALMTADIPDIYTLISALFSDAEFAAKPSKTTSPAIRWYMKREAGSVKAAKSLFANLAMMLSLGDLYDAKYGMRDLSEIRGHSYDDKCTFTQFNAWLWDRDRTQPYPSPLFGGETLVLLVDMVIWARAFAPENLDPIERFVEEFRSKSIDVKTVRAMRLVSQKIDRSTLVKNPQNDGRRSHLTVNRIHSLLDNIEHLGRSDISFHL